MTEDQKSACASFANYLTNIYGYSENGVDQALADFFAETDDDHPDTDEGITCPECEGPNGFHSVICSRVRHNNVNVY